MRRLKLEARKAKIQCDFINPVDCQLVIDGKESRILSRAVPLPEYGLAVVKHFEMLGIFSVNSSQAIAESRNKMRSLQVLTQAGLQVPSTVLTRSTYGLRASVDAVKGLPVVLKVLQGTQGVGVMLVHTPISLGSVLDTLRTLDQDVMIQHGSHTGGGVKIS